MNETADYKKYVMRQLGLQEAQFVPLPKTEAIDADELEKGIDDEAGEHNMTPEKARLTAKQHLSKANQGHYYSGMDKAKKAGMLKDEGMISPTARPPTILALGIRGSTTGGLPSGADQQGDISPTKVGGYDRVKPQNLNSKLVDKTPDNPEIHQSSPINDNPSTEAGVTHPHQIQVTAHEEPQSVTGASTDSDPTLTLKSATPKGIEIDIPGDREEPEQAVHDEDDHTAMIPATSLSETFARHRKLMLEKLGLCKCGCKPSECTCKPTCECGCNKKVEECATCGCGDPNDTHGMKENLPQVKEPNFAYCVGCGKKMETTRGDKTQHKVCDKCLGYKPGETRGGRLAENEDAGDEGHCSACQGSGEGHADGTKCIKCGGSGTKKKSKKEPREYEIDEQQRIDESYAAPFQRMRSLAGVGNMILTSNGLFENKNDPGANKPFNTHWKMDKEKAGFVKIDENKLKAVKASLERKSKRGSLSDKELELVKKLDEVISKRKKGTVPYDQREDDVAYGDHQNDPNDADKRFAKMEKDKTDRPAPFDRVDENEIGSPSGYCKTCWDKGIHSKLDRWGKCSNCTT